MRSVLGQWRTAGVALLVTAIAGCGSTSSTNSASPTSHASASPSAPLKVGVVLDGPLNDGGWNTIWQNAGAYLKAHMSGVKVTLVPNISPGAQAENAARALASQGYNLVVLTGGYPDSNVAAVSHAFPHTWFANEAGTEVQPNQIPFSVAIEQARYLDGIVAGSLTKSGKIGEVGGFPIPIEVRTLDAFEEGVRSVNPTATTKVLWVNSFYAPSAERQAAQALASSGIDTLVMDSNTPAVPSVARKQNLNLVGYGLSDAREAPTQWLSAFTFNWGPYLVAWAKGIQHGTLKSRLYYWGLKDGVVGQTAFGPRVSPKVEKLVASARTRIIAGKLNVLGGSDVASDATSTQSLNACCTKFVAGAVGSLPSH